MPTDHESGDDTSNDDDHDAFDEGSNEESSEASNEEPAGQEVEPVDTHDGDVLLAASWLGTGVLLVASLLAIASSALEPVLVAVSLILFLLGIVLFARAFLFAVNQRREDLIGIGGLFFLAGSAPRRVQLHLLGSFAAQVVIGLATAALRPYTALAFAVLASMFGLGLAGLWGAIHGTFPHRPEADGGTRVA